MDSIPVIDGPELPAKCPWLSNDKRSIIIGMKESDGFSFSEISDFLDVNKSTARKIYGIYKKTGRIKCKNTSRNSVKMTQNDERLLYELIEEDCTITLDKLCQKLQRLTGRLFSKSCIHNHIIGFNYSFKRAVMHAHVADTESAWKKCREFASTILHQSEMKKYIIFFDEAGFQASMRPVYARAKKGESPVLHSQKVKTVNKTLMAAISRDGVLKGAVLHGNGNGAVCLKFFMELLQILWNKGIHPVTVVMDNISFHHSKGLKTLFDRTGNELLFLPPYSPFFNPIENCFAQWKYWVRNAQCTDENQLIQCIHNASLHITQQHCLNFIEHGLENARKCLNGERNLH